jgi:hypothetical protein
MPSNLYQSLQSEVLATLIVGIISYAIGRGTEYLIQTIKKRRGPLAGSWIQKAYDPDTRKIKKVDQINCTQIDERVEAKITRILPEDQQGRTWKFIGDYRGGELFGSFKSTGGKVPSHGNIFMRIVGEKKFRGSYTKSNISYTEEDAHNFVISTKQIPLEWELGSVPLKELQAMMGQEADLK